MIILTDLAILMFFPNFCHVLVGMDFVLFVLVALSLNGINHKRLEVKRI